MKWFLLICFSCMACQQAKKPGSDTVARLADTTEQQGADTPAVLPTTAGLPADKLIVPGESVGKTHLGTDASQLEGLLGRPDLSDAAMGKAWLTWKGKGTQLDIYTTYKDSTMQEKTVQQIRTTSPFFSTAGNAKVGAPLAAVREVFPGVTKAAHYTDGGKTVVIYDDKEAGIAFETGTSGTQETCTGIIVHKKGANVTDVYLTLHPDMQRY